MISDHSDCFGTGQNDVARYLSRAAERRVPLSVSIELTRRCNYRCVHCYLGSQEAIWKHRHRELSTDRIYRLIDELVSVGTLFFTLTGGDPMLRSDFKDIYEYAAKSGLLVTVFSNGSLITQEIVETFRYLPPRMVEITVYGTSNATYEAITQKKGSYEATMNGIHKLHRAGIPLRLKTMVLTLNVDEFQEIRRLAEDMELKFRYDCSLHSALVNDDNDGCINCCNNAEKKSLHGTLQYRLAPERAAEVDMMSEDLYPVQKPPVETTVAGKKRSTLYYCGAGKNYFHINPYGLMQPCLIVPSHCYDLDDGGIQEAWETVMKEFAGTLVTPEFQCNSCAIQESCTACPAVHALRSGSPELVDEYYCRYATKRTENAKKR